MDTVGSGRAESSACAAEVSVSGAGTRVQCGRCSCCPSLRGQFGVPIYAKEFTVLNYRVFTVPSPPHLNMWFERILEMFTMYLELNTVFLGTRSDVSKYIYVILVTWPLPFSASEE